MSPIPQAMIFAAGFGKRLKPLTDHTPKPLIPIGNTTCLDLAIQQLQKTGVEKIVVNTHHLANQIHEHLKQYPKIVISHESEILETGGGLINALPHFDTTQPLFIVNGDIWWQDGPIPMLQRMQKAWDPAKMDFLLLLVPKETAIGYFAKGDYFLKNDHQVEYRGQHEFAPYVYPGVLILNPKALPSIFPANSFSIKALFDQVEAKGRLYGLVHDGQWGDIGSPKGLEYVRNCAS